MKIYRVGKTIGKLLIQVLVAVEVLIFIAAFPVLFENLTVNFKPYIESVYELNSRIFTLSDFYTADGKNSLFPFILYRYFNSMKMLAMGITVAIAIAFSISYLALIFFKKKIRYLKSFLELLESIPDLIFILLLQFSVVFIYKQTGVKLAQVVTLREEAILLPVISLSVPISFYITKVLLHYIEEELEKYYVSLARAKGMHFSYILNVHVLRNIADGMFGTSKTIFWSSLSTLLIVDYLFNMNGLLRMMLTSTDPFFIGSVLIFVPFFIIYRIYEVFSFDQRKEMK
ncbi:MAG: ABC transporter permease subunit [Neobacillus sp.]